MPEQRQAANNKLHPPKWLLCLKNLKFWLLHARPIPYFSRERCEGCSFVFNLDLYRSCPKCIGSSAVWVVVDRNGRVLSVKGTREDAHALVLDLWADGEYSTIEEHEIR